MAAHFPLGPSGAHRWIPCPGSYELGKTIPEVFSLPAREGTAAHEVAERLLLDNQLGNMAGEEPYIHVPTDHDIEVGLPDMEYDKIGEYVDYCHSLVKKNSLVFVEYRADYSTYIEGAFGTADFVCLTGRRLDIVDFKYGANVQVDATKNEQLMLYGLGVYDTLQLAHDRDITAVHLHVHQPRRNHIDTWKTTPAELIKFGVHAARQGQKALDGVQEFNPGDKQCQFCKAQGICKAKLTRDYALARKVMDMAEACAAGGARTEELAAHAIHFKTLKKSMETVSEELNRQARLGIPVPGFKLGEARTNRHYIEDEETVIEEMKLHLKVGDDELFEKKLISITAAEKLFPSPKAAREARWWQELLIKPDGGLTLVPDTDSRPEILIETAEELFKNAKPVTDETEEI